MADIPFSISQATSPNVPPGVANGINAGFGAGVSEFGDDPPQAPTDPGVGQQDDRGSDADAQEGGFYGESAGATTQAVNLDANLVNEQIAPRSNVLDKFSSYTYRASVYLVTPQQYAQLLVSKKRTVNGYQLLFQSGGAPIDRKSTRLNSSH